MEIHTCQKSGLQHGGWLSWEKTTMFSVLFTPSTSNSLQFGFYAHGLSVYMIIKGGAIFFDSYFPPRAKAKADFFFFFSLSWWEDLVFKPTLSLESFTLITSVKSLFPYKVT